MPKQFAFCRVCRQNHNQGRGHRYSAKHKRSLELVLAKLRKRVDEVRPFLANKQVTNETQSRNKFWCDFCEQEVSEQHSVLLFAEAINHFANERHVDNVRSFFAENGGDVKKQHQFFITAAEASQWDEATTKVTVTSVEELTLPLESAKTASTLEERSRLVPPLEGSLESSDLRGPQIVQLSVIGNPLQKPAEGNVHTGAPPPWLKQSTGVGNASPIVSSSPPLPLSRTQERKLAKARNPNRVGAAWAEKRRAELESEQRGQTAAGSANISSWLPSFGRVWQSGSRRDTRKEFEAEKHRRGKRRGRDATNSSVTSGNIELKPYVSKKQRMEAEGL